MNVKKRMAVHALLFVTLLACLALVARHFNATISRADTFSASLLLAPYWAFGFGFGDWLRGHLKGRVVRIATPLLLMASYLASGHARVFEFFGMSAVVLAVALLLACAGANQPGCNGWFAVGLLGIPVDLRLFDRAW